MIVELDDRTPRDEPGCRTARRTVEQAAAGSHGAWEQIFRSVYPRLRAYAERRVGIDAADDVVSETMARAVAGITTFRWTESGIEPWLFGIARRVAADHHRSLGRRRRSHPLAPPAAAGPGDALEAADERQEVRAAFDQLPQAEQEVLELRVIAGMTPDEVAKILGKRPGAVRTAQSRALAHLRTQLGRQ